MNEEPFVNRAGMARLLLLLPVGSVYRDGGPPRLAFDKPDVSVT